jgi:hypothetical protein
MPAPLISRFAFRLVLLVALLLPCMAVSAEDPETVHFGFAVEDGETWLKTMETKSVRDLKGRAPVSETEVHSDVRMTFERGTQGTTSVVLEALTAETKLNGLVQANPAQSLALGHRTRLHLDASGKAIAGDGFDKLMRRFERDLDPESFAAVRRQLTAEAMKQGEMGEWNRPLQGLRGEEVRVGDVWLVLSEEHLQGSYVALSGTLSFEGWTELDGIRILRVVLRYDSQGAIYAAAESTAVRTLNLRPAERQQYSRHNLVLEAETTWLISPERGLPLYETHLKTMKVPLSAEPGADKGVMEESHTYRYRLQDTADGS